MGPPAQAGFLPAPTLGFPLLLAWEAPGPRASGNLSQRGREGGGPTGAGDPRSVPDRTHFPGSRVSQGSQWAPGMGI